MKQDETPGMPACLHIPHAAPFCLQESTTTRSHIYDFHLITTYLCPWTTLGTKCRPLSPITETMVSQWSESSEQAEAIAFPYRETASDHHSHQVYGHMVLSNSLDLKNSVGLMKELWPVPLQRKWQCRGYLIYTSGDNNLWLVKCSPKLHIIYTVCNLSK